MTIAFDPRVGLTWIERVRAGGERERTRDRLAVEEPLEFRVDGEALAVTMRTPGNDDELAVGFLAGEGLIAGRDDVVAVGPSADLAANVVEVTTRGGLRRDAREERRFYLTSSCGVCGKGALEFVRREAPAAAAGGPVADRARGGPRRPRTRSEWPVGLRAHRRPARDGAVRRGRGAARATRGRRAPQRHGQGARRGAARRPLPAHRPGGLRLSERAGLVRARPEGERRPSRGVIAIGAPSTLAVDLAREQELLLCGFVRGDSFNVYAGPERLAR
jgi:FdhD protein